MIRHARRPRCRDVILEADVSRGDTDGSGDEFLAGALARNFRELRAVEFREAAGIGEPDATAHRPDSFLEHDHSVMFARQRKALARQADGGPDCRMACKRELPRRREDPHLGSVRRIVGRQHENGLREVELARNALHGDRTEPFRIEHDGERVSRQRTIREDVKDLVAACHRSPRGVTQLGGETYKMLWRRAQSQAWPDICVDGMDRAPTKQSSGARKKTGPPRNHFRSSTKASRRGGRLNLSPSKRPIAVAPRR